jgi:hypothetical protein
MKYFLLILLLFIVSCKTCPPSAEISNEIVTVYVGYGLCANYTEVKDDIDEVMDEIDYCGLFKESDYSMPNGIPCSSKCVACHAAITKVKPRKEWGCKKTVSPLIFQSVCLDL